MNVSRASSMMSRLWIWVIVKSTYRSRRSTHCGPKLPSSKRNSTQSSRVIRRYRASKITRSSTQWSRVIRQHRTSSVSPLPTENVTVNQRDRVVAIGSTQHELPLTNAMSGLRQPRRLHDATEGGRRYDRSRREGSRSEGQATLVLCFGSGAVDVRCCCSADSHLLHSLRRSACNAQQCPLTISERSRVHVQC